MANEISNANAPSVVDSSGNPVEDATIIAVKQEDVATLSQSQATEIQALAKLSDVNGDFTFSESELYRGQNHYVVVALEESGEQRGTPNYPHVDANGSVIPDREDLHARYDFSQEDGSLPIIDQTGNGYDLTIGDYIGVSTNINGVQAGDFDGSADRVSGNFSTLSQPNTIFAVYVWDSFDTNSYANIYDSNDTGQRHTLTSESGMYSYAGDKLFGNAEDTNPHITSVLYNTTSSIYREDGTQVGSGNVGTDGLGGFTIGGRAEDTGEYANARIGEILIYPEDKSGIFSDVESYLSNKWGITV